MEALMRLPSAIAICCLIILITNPSVALAYIGPGAGIAAIGTVLALIGGILLAIIAFIWYPIKRMLAKIRNKDLIDKDSHQS